MRRDLIDAPEKRLFSASEFEFRSGAGSAVTLTGYASVFNAPYDIFGGPDMGGWEEKVDSRAFDATLKAKPDLHLLVNHEGLPLARTRSGTLKLTTDSHGLHVSADLDSRDDDVRNLMVKMERGDLDEMSFGFRTKRDEWTDADGKPATWVDGDHRTLLEVSLHKGDVSVVNFGANPATHAELNMASALDYIKRLGDEAALAEIRKLDDGAENLAMIARLERKLNRPKPKSFNLSIEAARRIAAGEAEL